MHYWLLKSEPHEYSWEMLKSEQSVIWNGVRNYQARNYIAQMTPGDLCFFYHSGAHPAIVGVVKVLDRAFIDPSCPLKKFLAIKIGYDSDIASCVSLHSLKSCSDLNTLQILKQKRLSVSHITKNEWCSIMRLTKNI